MFDYGIYLLVRIIISILQALSLEQARGFALFMAWLCADVLHVRAKLVRENIAHAFPTLSPEQVHEVERGMWRHLFFMLMEAAFAERKIHLSNWKQYVSLENEAAPLQAMYEGRPLIYALGHLGNFEFAGYILGLIGIPPYTVARTLDNPHLNQYLLNFRNSTGQYIIPKDAAAPMLEEAMERGHSAAILMDQHAGPKGFWVTYFGREASTHKVIPLLARSFHASVAVSAPFRKDEKLFHFHIVTANFFTPEALMEGNSPKEAAQILNTTLENLVRREPHQYWWLHNRWKPRKKSATKS
ncbi:MAG: lysophospholipid acyltransferase family protein [Planctomycetia bacterium]|nr:lysophospholipid acyltransferase family protein [Planctomycetia bacterium]